MSQQEYPQFHNTAGNVTANYYVTGGDTWTTAATILNPAHVNDYHNSSSLKWEELKEATQTKLNEAAKDKNKEETVSKRLVQVVIIDPDKKVPVEDSVLYMDEKPRVTDLTDQELYFELNMKEMLDTHNAKREAIEIEDETSATTKVKKLKPIKIRDLKMVVIESAKF